MGFKLVICVLVDVRCYIFLFPQLPSQNPVRIGVMLLLLYITIIRSLSILYSSVPFLSSVPFQYPHSFSSLPIPSFHSIRVGSSRSIFIFNHLSHSVSVVIYGVSLSIR